MRLAALSLLVLVGCNTGGEGDDYPVEPGNGVTGSIGTTGPTFPDAALGDGNATSAGRVCNLSEVLVWDSCDATGLAGVMVTVGSATATVSETGDFEITDPPIATNLRWRVSGNTQMKTLSDYPADRFLIPAIRTNTYEDLAQDALVVPDPNAGAIFVQVIRQGLPVEGATAALTVPSGELVRYDDANGSASFSVGSTRTLGKIWFPNVAPGAAVAFTVTPPTAVGAPETLSVVVEAETATFVTLAIP